MAQEVNIKLLGTSDVHGRIVPWSYGADIEDKSVHYAQIATYVKMCVKIIERGVSGSR